ncbi:unnamed protein product [Phytophthora lilii]|uniref:Unnamed protein product n=1 Tax=Phytophthora lilii TaxID=2077276 RepID=A0A9W6WY36_9STRA|nr:unnamed protein product [Phytophthora lilii]
MLVTVLVLMLCSAQCGVEMAKALDGHAAITDRDIVNFLNDRVDWHPMCLYTFDDPAIGSSISVANRVPDDACPFDALQPDDELVTSLNTASSFWQLGVRLLEDPNNDSTRVQLSSTSTVSARDFFTMAAVRNDSAVNAGVTFEMVLRRHKKTNQSMTLFSIANEYDKCVDPGFRLDLNEHQVFAFIYFLPVLEEGGEAGMEACYEQRLFSVDNSAVCQLPPLLEPTERSPPVQITVTLDPSSERGLWKTDFYMSYTDPETLERVDCEVHDEQHPPNTQVLNKLVEGRYRLYLGNSPRNATSPRRRKRLAPARQLQLPTNMTHLNATERLRLLLKQKLMSITGPRMPKAMRIFGDSSLSMHVLGVTFPPLSEDSPLAFLRSKIADFKEQYGDRIVDYLVNMVQQKADNPVVLQRPQERSSGSQDILATFGESSQNGGAFSRTNLFQGAAGAEFDLFHFAIYRRVVPEDQINSITRQWLLPSRQFSLAHQTLHIPEDSLVLLNLTMLHGVFDDLRLELRELPHFGKVLLFPNQSVVRSNNKDAFRVLPLENQRKIFFQPEPDQNNDNLPLPNTVAFSRRLMPYATISFGIAESLAGRGVNKSAEAKIDIFVEATNDAPRPRAIESKIHVEKGVPVVLNLRGDDIDGAPPAPESNVKAQDSSNFLSSFTFSNISTVVASYQLLKIVQMPLLGKIFDCNISCSKMAFSGRQDLGALESNRIFRNSTAILNATHSTNLLYIYDRWSHNTHERSGDKSVIVDELRYQLSDGDPSALSNVAVVKFVLVDNAVSTKAFDVVRLEEDSPRLINLSLSDPLAAFFNSRTRIQVTTLPRHGTLYQFNDNNNNNNNTGVTDGNVIRNIGARITTETIIADPFDRVFYVPRSDYFNLNQQNSVDLVSEADFFEYQICNSTQTTEVSLVVHANSPAARFVNGSVPRRVELEVVNVPDALVILPPFIFSVNASSTYLTPVGFEDPDSINNGEQYQANLEAVDGVSEFDLGFAVTDNDVMTGCPFERPCTLLRSTSRSHLNVSSSSTRDTELRFHITTQLYDSSRIQVTGTKTALNTALSMLTFRDLTGLSPGVSHTAEFRLWIKRVGADNESDTEVMKAEATFKVIISADEQIGSASDKNMFSALDLQLERYLYTLLVLLAGWIVLLNTSYLSFGCCCCCCCCCTKVRKKRRKQFEQQRRAFQKQVAQNDYEYSVLLVRLADIFLEPNMLASVSLLRSCTSYRTHEKPDALTVAFALRTMLPLLESERQGTRFVFQLMLVEYSKGLKSSAEIFKQQEFLSLHSTASMALAYFCRVIGGKWISELLLKDNGRSDVGSEDTTSYLETLLDRLAKNIHVLPAEIVILCRACVKLFRRDEICSSSELELNAVHLVFFNHFLGPALLFPLEYMPGFNYSTEWQNALSKMAYDIAGFTNKWIDDEHYKVDDFRTRSSSSDSLFGRISRETESTAILQHRYERILTTIAQSTTVPSAYNPSENTADIDSELMGLCLMNIHSLLDNHFPQFKRKLLETSTNMDQIEATISRTSSLLKSLSLPFARIQDLVDYAQPELLQDPLLWSGFSLQEWRVRAKSRHHLAPSIKNQPASPLPELFPDHVVLEQRDSSPQSVDWLEAFSSS